jgi:hypothetical protein
MKKQIALVLAGTAASIAGGLRLIQELVDRSSSNEPATESAAGSGAGSEPATPKASAGKAGAAGGTGGSGGTGAAGGKTPDNASRAELYEMATKLKISGRSKMSKAELLEAVKSAG